ncbi:MAG: hypothetical protein ABSB41_00825 [Anaerolineales bacterium]|jgi:tRNA nucleotidyltransferase (CCA-adding enzyme)
MPTRRYVWPQEARLRRGLLEKTLPPERLSLLRRIAEQAASMDMSPYIVGGFVRDLLLGQVSQDFDLVVEGDAIALAHALQSRYGGRVTAHARFRTAKWHLKNEATAEGGDAISSVDLISARRESYAQPGALPHIQAGGIEDDISRRDFTINTLALRLDRDDFGEMLDEMGGLDDLNRGVIRVLHPASYQDDPNRILRAVRYEQRYGFEISTTDREYIASARDLLEKLSADRIRHELDWILAEAKAPEMLNRLEEFGILNAIHPALQWSAEMRRVFLLNRDNPPPAAWGVIPNRTRLPRRVALGYLLWLMHLTQVQIRALDSRLHFRADLRDSLLEASDLRQRASALQGAKPSRICSRLEDVPLLAVYAVSLAADPPERRLLESFGTSWRHIKPRTTGNDLKARGLAASPAYQAILQALRDAWLDGDVDNPEEESTLLDQLIKSQADPSRIARNVK